MYGIDVEPMRFSAVFGNKRSPGDVSRFGLIRPDGGQRLEVGIGDAVQVVESIEALRADAAGVVGHVARAAGRAAEVNRLLVIMRVSRLEPVPAAAQILPILR